MTEEPCFPLLGRRGVKQIAKGHLSTAATLSGIARSHRPAYACRNAYALPRVCARVSGRPGAHVATLIMPSSNSTISLSACGSSQASLTR